MELGNAKAFGHWQVYARDAKTGQEYNFEFDNAVVNEGLDELLEMALAAGTQESTWYVGLTDSTPTVAAGDTMASHTGWSEVTGYDEAARQTWTPGSVSGQSVDNSVSKATFTITSDSTTIGGAFLTSVSTKGGTTGKLYAAGAFSGGDITLSSGSTLEITATFTTAAA